MSINKDEFIKLVKSAVANNVSDIHLRSEERPCFRIRGDLIPVKVPEYSNDDLKTIAKILLENKSLEIDLDNLTEFDGSYSIEGLCRIRFNIVRYLGKLGLILRIIDLKVPTTESLGLPSVINKIASANSGLILVTGATGSGKSSTLAAMINFINQTRAQHILTLEDPVEYVHSSIKSRVTQREIGHDSQDFNTALRASLRQDPDVILIGEMRDIETISIALKAAETGHLVLGTVHTTNALNTVGRLISMFPTDEQSNARARIADNLYSVISQRLVKTADGKGRVAAQEIMITSPGIKEALSNPEKIHEIYTYIEKGKSGYGTQSFDQHLTDLYKSGKISLQEAKLNATSSEDFERNLIFADKE